MNVYTTLCRIIWTGALFVIAYAAYAMLHLAHVNLLAVLR